MPLCDAGAELLWRSLLDNDALRLLSVCGCGIGDRSTRVLQDMLFQNQVLESLLLADNRCAPFFNHPLLPSILTVAHVAPVWQHLMVSCLAIRAALPTQCALRLAGWAALERERLQRA